MTVETRGIWVKEFDDIMATLEIKPSDTAHQFLMTQTKNKKRSIITILESDEKQQASLSSPYADGNLPKLDGWEIKELMSISKYATMKRDEDENFTLENTDAIVFKNWKVEPACTQH